MKTALMIVLIVAVAAITCMGQAPTLRIVTEDPKLPSELYYGDIKVKPLRLRPGTNVPITIDDADFFASQHYVDFLRRFPDAPDRRLAVRTDRRQTWPSHLDDDFSADDVWRFADDRVLAVVCRYRCRGAGIAAGCAPVSGLVGRRRIRYQRNLSE